MFAKTKLNKIAVAVALSVGLSTAAMAQETSSTIRGTIVTESGQTVTGAKITVIDTRTNSVREFTSTNTGTFTIRGLRIGGPYTLIVEDELGSRTVEGVFANLGEDANVTIDLVAASDIERITVTGAASGLITETLGPSSNFGFDDLQYQPSIDRDIKDVLQTDPRISIDATNNNAIQCAGVNNRSNSLTVDGVPQNDNFGLNGNGYPTERLPFPFDAIDQVDVQLAPYDVTYGGFTGCNINAVFRSGTNDVFGSVFYDYTSDALQGDETSEGQFDIPDFDESRYGFTVGAPIIKDKLFIFAAFEKHEPIEIYERGPEGAGFAQPIGGLTTQVLEEVRSIARDVYGYEVGNTISSADEKEEKVLVKIDWQINDDHRAALTYQNTDGNNQTSTGLSSGSYAFDDRYYERANELTTTALSIYSDWTSNFFTEVRYAVAEVKNGQIPGTSDTDFGDIRIEDAVPNVDILLGADTFRQANVLNYDTTNFKLAGTYLTGDHEITAGIEFQNVEVFNLFVPGSQGVFTFSGLDDFRNQIANEIEYSIPGSLNPADGAAEFEFRNTTMYIQDRWMVTDDLTVTYGLRYDTWDADRDPVANANFQQRYGFTNAAGPDFELLQPRLGFNYTFDDVTFLYGGLGIFSGGNPNVWLSNNYSNNGVTILSSQLDGTDAGLDGSTTPGFGFNLPQESIDGLVGGDGAVNALDPDFDIPSILKLNIGIQREFGDGYVVGAEVIHSKNRDFAKTIPLNTVQVGTAPDGRPIYEDVDLLDPDCVTNPTSSDCSGRSGTDYFLTNSDENGDSTIFTTTLRKRWDTGFSVNAGYSYSDINDGSPMNSSTASSNFGNLSVSDLNEPGIATSNYEVQHRFTMNVGYRYEFFEDYDTRFNLFFVRQKGRPFSYNFDNDPGFGDERGFEDRNLLYIPLENDPIVQYGPGFDQAAFNELIAAEGLEQYRGQILPRNTQNSAWFGRVDLRVSQELPGFMPNHRGEVFFAIRNLGNLLNPDWGNLRQVNFEFNNPIVDATIQDDGTYLYTNFDGDRGQDLNINASTWSMRVGVKYTF
ncbi:carboxypeptidase regulatory-like domain-containing protein [Glaciecola sp. XM2]|uniref:TonB-dependent receptor n=1 Tax=Glaciecola sp. XM2 TaxID=1914931 RepID=UPI001BDF2428|nr:TonB-dependent receptor [Glaciecola sp. XM2]MBT1450418.1 carboxypeptidase regulatory-like domain-containing protein [Glaciecola sp. XM2]